ncbi:hypothetical protein DRQ15_09590, partial [candidate division KSB1 bacterium]
FLSSPIIGIGALNFSSYLITFGHTEFIRSKIVETLSPHNFFLQVAAEEGLFGFIAFILILVVLYNIIFKINPKNPSTSLEHYYEGFKLFFISLLIGLFLGFIAGQFRFFFSIFCGLSLSSLRLIPLHKQTA